MDDDTVLTVVLKGVNPDELQQRRNYSQEPRIMIDYE